MILNLQFIFWIRVDYSEYYAHSVSLDSECNDRITFTLIIIPQILFLSNHLRKFCGGPEEIRK